MKSVVKGLCLEVFRNQLDFTKKLTLIVGPNYHDKTVVKSEFRKLNLFSQQPVTITLPKRVYDFGKNGIIESELFLMVVFHIKDEMCTLNILSSVKPDFSQLLCNTKMKWKHEILAFHSLTFEELRSATVNLVNNVFL